MAIAPWQRELRDSIRTLDQLERYMSLNNREGLKKAMQGMRLSITPHSLSLIDFSNLEDPLLKMAVPSVQETNVLPEELQDPIGDETKSPVPFLTHRYKDRVLIYPTFFCALFCRFCFRRFKTGEATPGPQEDDIQRILAYLRAHPEVEEVIFTGGDPFTLLDVRLEEWLQRLRTIPSIQRIRFHTRVPVNLPSRITPELVSLLKKYSDATHPIIVVTHFNHPREIAPANIEAIARLVDTGIVVRNQHPLLKGVNDDATVLEQLYRMLSNIRVTPYYLHHLDLARGTNHFRVPLEQGMALMDQLQGQVTGIALPRYVLDLPGGKGKIPINHSWLKKVADKTWEARTPTGETVLYKEP